MDKMEFVGISLLITVILFILIGVAFKTGGVLGLAVLAGFLFIWLVVFIMITEDGDQRW